MLDDPRTLKVGKSIHIYIYITVMRCQRRKEVSDICWVMITTPLMSSLLKTIMDLTLRRSLASMMCFVSGQNGVAFQPTEDFIDLHIAIGYIMYRDCCTFDVRTEGF